jgi:hypothetical protein
MAVRRHKCAKSRARFYAGGTRKGLPDLTFATRGSGSGAQRRFAAMQRDACNGRRSGGRHRPHLSRYADRRIIDCISRALVPLQDLPAIARCAILAWS